jgi:hypothetical protein
MTFDNRFAVWCYAANLPVYRSLGLRPTTVQRGSITISGPERAEFWTQFHAWAGKDYFDRVLDLDSFAADVCALDVVCPCGEQLSADDVGELLREIYQHCGAADHPVPTVDIAYLRGLR